MKKRKKAFVDSNYCVACGCCEKECPVGAINIHKGIAATVNFETCVGCGKCSKECPACVIEIREVNGEKEKTLV